MTLDEAIKLCEEGSKDSWNGHQTANGEVWQQMTEWLKELKAHREAWSKLKNDVVAYHNNYDYSTATHFLNIIDTRLSEIGGNSK